MPGRSGLGTATGRSPGGTLRTLNRPRRARVQVAGGDDGCERGTPLAIDGARVEFVRETWLVEDGWWTQRPLRRRYWEVVSVSGRRIVVYHDLVSASWFTQVG